MIIQSILDEAFKAYGKVVTNDFDVELMIEVLETKEAPADDVIYIASDEALEALEVSKEIAKSFFGNMAIQVGYCNGTNSKLNAVEYHRTSELCVAGTDLILLVGKQQDITNDDTYDTTKIEAFKAEKGTVFEMYATTLHYAPCSVEGTPFRNIVILPKGTNTELEEVGETKEDKLLVAKNKWLIAHEEGNVPGAFIGLSGKNIEV